MVFIPAGETRDELTQERVRNEKRFQEVYALSSPHLVKPQVLGDVVGENVVDLITRKAIEYGVDVQMALAVAKCESGYDIRIKGDDGESWGLWQIHSPAHPRVTLEQATDPLWATEWAMPRLKATPSIWTCYRNLYL